MNRAVLSLCLFGAALATANILIMQRQTCPSVTDVVAVFKETAPAVSTAKGKPAQAPKAAEKPVQAPKNKAANPAQGKPEQIAKAATTKSAAPPKGVDGTGSVNQKTPKPNGEKSSQKGSDRKQAGVSRPSRKTAYAGRWRRPDRYYEPPEYYWQSEYYGPPEHYGPPGIRFYPGW
jgi:hypothetical protein